MIVSMEQILDLPVEATDGQIGRCKDMLFDEEQWVIRYLVLDTHKWLPFGDKVVISPITVIGDDWPDRKAIPLRITQESIKSSPPLNENLPISREYEIKLFRYYGYGFYWMGPGLWGTYPSPSPLIERSKQTDMDSSFDDSRATGLRSMMELKNYSMEAADDKVGRVNDFAVDIHDWTIKCIDVDRGGLFNSASIEVPVDLVNEIDWLSKRLYSKRGASEFETENDSAKALD